MSSRVGRPHSQSLRASYDRSRWRSLLVRLGTCCRQAKVAVVARSPVHFEATDMRSVYTWSWATLVVVAVALFGLAGRLALTWLFITRISPDPGLVAAFNLGVSVGLGLLALLVTRLSIRRWLTRRRRRRAAGRDQL